MPIAVVVGTIIRVKPKVLVSVALVPFEDIKAVLAELTALYYLGPMEIPCRDRIDIELPVVLGDIDCCSPY